MTDGPDHAPGWGSVPGADTLRGDAVLPAVMTAPAPGGPPSGQPDASAGGPGYGPGRPRRGLRKGAVIGIVAGAAALVLLVVASGIGWSVGSDSHSAERPVQAFLQDVEDGRLSDALESAGIDRDTDDVLLTDAAYAEAGDKITAHRITSVDEGDDRATVRALLTQAGRSVPATFELERTGTDWGVFPVWELQPPSLGSVEVVVQGPTRSGVQVAGAQVATGDLGAVALRAFPGSYEVSADGGKWFTADASTAAVRGFGTPGTPVVLATTLTDAGQQAASKAVDSWVDGCVASPTATPDGCSFYAYGENPANTYTNQKWTLDARPAVGVGAWSSKGWLVETRSPGSASFTADFTGPAGRGRATAGPIDVNASGWITGFDDDGATFVPAVANGSSDSGS
ncbi:hypothetical protein [Curtobacterium sp. MCBD17_021]|uniref:hypothetical protein n=1 Tax=Curtobacterium sp. MCBD17_021 TaxID=2175665 RepID=UPI000DA8A37D|nr:hypothetical protein [Curtobacterium sp. MCBD17_021]PZE69709.1 hypothetical protein DEI83_01275 [Curtobacterium sp. MCBD17_021]